MFRYLLLIFFWFQMEISSSQEVFNEELFIRQLSSGHVYSMFQFTTHLNVNVFEKLPSHFNLFPKSLGEIISAFNIVELHLSLTQGRWKYNKWGYPIESAPTGIGLWIWFHPEMNEASVDENWQGVVHALSGQFCSSLNFINKDFTASPKSSFRPTGVWLGKHFNSTNSLRYATLPKETICTENLTPWTKLLPCGNRAGIATLLDALHLFDASYTSLAIHVRSICEDNGCSVPQFEFKQTISNVMDICRGKESCDWSFYKLYGRRLRSTCPVATISRVMIDANDKSIKKSLLSPAPDNEVNVSIEGVPLYFRMYELSDKNIDNFDVGVSIKFHDNGAKISPYLLVHKYTTGYGMEMGGIVCLITNSHPSLSIRINYLDIIPYYVRVYFHTLKIKINDHAATPEKLKYLPGYYGKRPTSLEFYLSIGAMSTASISIEFEKVFMDWMQYPPDAHHGFYIGSSVVSAYFSDISNSSGISEHCPLLSSIGKSCKFGMHPHIFRRIFSEPLLIRVPLPDFSMPYNVLCLTCTVIAIAFGSIYNLSTRTFHVEYAKEKSLKNKLTKLKEKVKSLLSKCKEIFFPARE